MTKRHITQTLRVVDPPLAKHWLTYYTFDKQRALRPHHVAFLAQAITQGFFRDGTPISFAVLNGHDHLVNGQHTLHAIIAANKGVRLTIEKHFVSSLAAIADLYASFDLHMRRPAQDIYAAYDFGPAHGLARSAVGALSAAMPAIIGGFIPATRGKDHPLNLFISNIHNRQQAMAQWADAAGAYFATFIDNVPGYRQYQAQRALVAAIGILTFRYCPTEAKEFWGRIAHREHLTRTMPEYRLGIFLDSTPANLKREGFLYARCVASAWNAAYTHRPLHRHSPRPLEYPMLVEGTPFRGHQDLWYFHNGALSWTPVPVEKESTC